MDKLILKPEDLDAAYRYWRKQVRTYSYKKSSTMVTELVAAWEHTISYQKMDRIHNKDFEDWIWDQGGSIKQEQGKRYLIFSEYERGIEFKLTTSHRGQHAN
jgi:hypothetical protein